VRRDNAWLDPISIEVYVGGVLRPSLQSSVTTRIELLRASVPLWITVVAALASRHTRRSVGNLAARRFERGVAQEGCGRSDLRTSFFLDALEQWIAWQAARAQQRKPEELRVVYLCGPEPLNDLRVLLELGVSP
jgi:hypothetical protein